MKARDKDFAIAAAILRRTGYACTQAEANTLRRASLTLHRWAELECGDSNDYASWAIERDETSGLPYMVTYPHTGATRRFRIPDRERGALRRVGALCKSAGLHFYHQTDPRGCALYIAAEPMSDCDYSSKGVAIC
jgi:hypothetical protein